MSGLTGEQIMEHWPLLCSVLWKRYPNLSRVQVDDIAGDAVYKAWRYRDSFEMRGDAALRGWLVQVAYTAAYDWFRVAKNHECPLSDFVDHRVTLDAGCDRQIDMLVIRDGLSRIDRIDREYLTDRMAGWQQLELTPSLSKAAASRREGAAHRAMRAAIGEIACPE